MIGYNITHDASMHAWRVDNLLRKAQLINAYLPQRYTISTRLDPIIDGGRRAVGSAVRRRKV